MTGRLPTRSPALIHDGNVPKPRDQVVGRMALLFAPSVLHVADVVAPVWQQRALVALPLHLGAVFLFSSRRRVFLQC